MNKVQAMELVRILVAAYSASWKPDEDALRLYRGMLAGPELDEHITAEVVLEQVRSEERFVPAPGVIYQRALKRSRDKFFSPKNFQKFADAIIESSPHDDHPGLLDAIKARDAIAAHPVVRALKGNWDETTWTIAYAIETFMSVHPERFPKKLAALELHTASSRKERESQTVVPWMPVEDLIAASIKNLLSKDSQHEPN